MTGRLLLLSVLIAALSYAGEREWVKLTTTNFELYTTAPENRARRAIEYFEHLHSFFSSALKLKSSTRQRIRLVGFRSMKESEEFRMHEGSAGHYTRLGKQELIVLGELTGQRDTTAVHEYVHLLIDRAELNIPRWLNEGMAELYSTLEPKGDEVIVGNLLAGRLATLKRHKWMSLKRLLNPELAGQLFEDHRETSVFYAQSWLLTHMLALSEDYRISFPRFLEALHQGSSSARAFYDVYNVDLDQVDKDLQRYLSGRVVAVRLPTPFTRLAINPRVEQPPHIESELLLTSLLSLAGKNEQAVARLAALEAQYPDDASVHEAMGYRALRAKDLDAAAASFGRALECNGTNAQMYLDYAWVLRSTGASPDEVIFALTKAVNADPNNEKARYRLGMLLTSERRYYQGLVHLARVRKLEAEQAPGYFRALALCYHANDRPEDAEKAIQRALDTSREKEDTRMAEQLREYMEYSSEKKRLAAAGQVVAGQAASAQTAPVAGSAPRMVRAPIKEDQPSSESDGTFGGSENSTMEGTLVALECLGEQARLRIRSDGHTFALAIYDPRSVRVTGESDGAVALNCGPQSRQPVRVTYEPMIDETMNTIGGVAAIEFQ